MATYMYIARDASGRRRRGIVTADDGRQARDQLRADGFRIEQLELRPDAANQGMSRRFATRSRRHRAEVTMAMRELATLLQAGIPLLDALDSLIQQHRKGFRESLVAVRDRVAGGDAFATALERESAFDEMTVGLIRVGEQAGNLDEVCEQIAEFRERSGELRDRVLSALIYPAIVLLISGGVTLFLMTVIVPMLLSNLDEMGRELPLPTRILKGVSDFLLAHGWWMAGLLSVSLACLAYALTTPNGARWAARMLLKVPVFGVLMQRQALSRMGLVLSSLLRSGVELVDGLKIAERASTNPLLRDALAALRIDLEAGKPMRESIAKHAIFTPALAQVFALGQQSGQLDRMLERISKDYDRQATILAGRLTAVVEPILILGLGFIVGFILFATMLPILEAGNVLSES